MAKKKVKKTKELLPLFTVHEPYDGDLELAQTEVVKETAKLLYIDPPPDDRDAFRYLSQVNKVELEGRCWARTAVEAASLRVLHCAAECEGLRDELEHARQRKIQAVEILQQLKASK